MEDSIYTTVLPLWWGLAFIGVVFLMRRNKDHTEDPTKRFFLQLLLLAIFAFVTYMPVGIMMFVAPVVLIIVYFKWLKGRAFTILVVALGVVSGVALTWVFHKFASDRTASVPVIAARFAEDKAGWNRELLDYAKKPLEFVKPDEPEDNLKPKGDGFFTPDLEDGDVRFAADGRAGFHGLELSIPCPEGMTFRHETIDGVLYLAFADQNGDIVQVVLFGRQGDAEALEKCREAYVDQNARMRDLQTAAEFFPPGRFTHFFLTDPEVAENSERAVLASAIVNVTPTPADGKSFGFGFDVEAYSGALALPEGSARIFIISALRDMRMNSLLPLHWIGRFLGTN